MAYVYKRSLSLCLVLSHHKNTYCLSETNTNSKIKPILQFPNRRPYRGKTYRERRQCCIYFISGRIILPHRNSRQQVPPSPRTATKQAKQDIHPTHSLNTLCTSRREKVYTIYRYTLNGTGTRVSLFTLAIKDMSLTHFEIARRYV